MRSNLAVNMGARGGQVLSLSVVCGDACRGTGVGSLGLIGGTGVQGLSLLGGWYAGGAWGETRVESIGFIEGTTGTDSV